MIITLLFIVVAIIGLIIAVKFNDSDDDEPFTTGVILFACGVFLWFISLIMILCSHIGVNEQIAENNIKYESLCERQEVIDSHYEDVSRSDVIKDIAEWNISVHNYQYWTYNPWTSWFHSKKVADNMKLIESD